MSINPPFGNDRTSNHNPGARVKSLIEFLLARIAEDEAAAGAAAEEDSHGKAARWRDAPSSGAGQSTVWNGVGQAVVSHAYHSQGAHIARHDPARVLAGCAAKRRIVEWCAAGASQGPWPMKAAAYVPDYYTPMRFLATAYADHPDYREEWKP